MANEISAEQYKVLKKIEDDIRKTIVNNLYIEDNILSGRVDSYTKIEGSKVIVFRFKLNGTEYSFTKECSDFAFTQKEQIKVEAELLELIAQQIVMDIMLNRTKQNAG